ncbi:MAG: pyridoxal-phosphate dependent enzyme, partial [Flavobacteriales bacterium]
GKYLKEQNPEVEILGIDAYGSALKKYHQTGEFDENEVYTYITEGIGEDLIPDNVDWNVIDHFEKVNDKDGAIMTRKLAKEEGLFMGYSAGSALQGLLQMKDRFGPDDVVVILFHDSGSRYVGKVYNDDWMKERGFLESKDIRAKDLIAKQGKKKLITVDIGDPINKAVEEMTQKGISQIPVRDNGDFVGALTDQFLFSKLIENPDMKSAKVENFVEPPFPIVEETTPIEEVSQKIDRKNTAVLMTDSKGETYIITRQDVIGAIG